MKPNKIASIAVLIGALFFFLVAPTAIASAVGLPAAGPSTPTMQAPSDDGSVVGSIVGVLAAAGLAMAIFAGVDSTAYGPTPTVSTGRFQAIYDKSYHTIDYTNSTGTDIAAGQVVVVGTIPMVAVSGIANGATGTLTFLGQIYVDKDSSTFTQGDAVYWNTTGSSVEGTASAGAATSTASGAYLMGLCAADAATGAARVKVQLTAARRTTTVAGSVTADDITGSDSSLGITGKAGVGAGTGGAVVVTAGASAGASGTAGAVTIDAGAATGGTGAAVTIGATNATGITLGAASIPVTVPGPMTRGIGASTAAAGSSTSDAGVLPAGTAGVYPTTAADDTKGVRIDAADKVTGRTLFIGNGVYNKILKVYPPSGGTINGASADAAFSSASGKGVVITCLSSSGNTWLAW